MYLGLLLLTVCGLAVSTSANGPVPLNALRDLILTGQSQHDGADFAKVERSEAGLPPVLSSLSQNIKAYPQGSLKWKDLPPGGPNKLIIVVPSKRAFPTDVLNTLTSRDVGKDSYLLRMKRQGPDSEPPPLEMPIFIVVTEPGLLEKFLRFFL